MSCPFVGSTKKDRAETQGFDENYYRTLYRARTPDWYSWLLSEVIRFGKPGTILDLGCGLGLFVELANKWGVSAKGIDGSEPAVRLALERTPILDLQQRDLMLPLPFADKSFDNIMMHQVIPSFAPGILTDVLAECHRVLGRGGMLFIFSIAKSNRRSAAVKMDPSQHSPLHPSELRASLQSAGFSVIREPNSARFFPRNRFLARLAAGLMCTPLRDWAAGSANAYARRI